jgi:hypothetical protein
VHALVAALIAAGAGKPFDPVGQSSMKEWVLVEDDARAGAALASGRGAA